MKRAQPKAFLALLILATLACNAITLPGDQPGSPAPTATPSLADWVQVYFTDPNAPGAGSYRGGPDRDLADAILDARVSVDMAVLNLNLWSVRDALLSAHQNGVAVRLVVESDYIDGAEIQQLKDAGIPILGDRQEGLMHDKFVIIDRSEIWMGSLNYTTSDGYRNNNNLLNIRSSRLAANYSVEFEEMFVEDRFGPRSPANTPDPLLKINGVQIETYFSPDDGVADRLMELIQSAKTSIDFLAYSFTADDLAAAMCEKSRAGLRVRGVMEAAQVESNTGSEYQTFRQAGVDLRLDGNSANMHHKVIVIDGKITVVGSYNFSRNAEEINDENVLVIHDEGIARLFLDEFQRIYADSKSP